MLSILRCASSRHWWWCFVPFRRRRKVDSSFFSVATAERGVGSMAGVTAERGPSQQCQYSYLGSSGLRVSNMCLGGMNFGRSHYGTPGQLNEPSTHELINRFVQWGGNFFDTCGLYGYGDSERFLGSWLAGQERDRFVVATKVRFPYDSDHPFGATEAGSNPNAVGLSRRHIVKAVEDSLQRLQTDYIDLLQTHAWDDAVPLEETLMTLNDLVRSGKVRYVGVSNVTGWQLQRIVDLNKEMGFNPLISLQQQYSLVSRFSELEPFQVCKLFGVGVLAWSPLKGGFLTGKVRPEVKPTEGRLGWFADKTFNLQSGPNWTTVNTEKNWAVLDTARRIAEAKGKTVAQVSIRWLLQKSVVSSVIFGATKTSQLDDNMAAATGQWQLSAEEMQQLDEVSRPELPYPYDLVWKVNKFRTNPWNPAGYV